MRLRVRGATTQGQRCQDRRTAWRDGPGARLWRRKRTREPTTKQGTGTSDEPKVRCVSRREEELSGQPVAGGIAVCEEQSARHCRATRERAYSCDLTANSRL